MNNSFKTRDLQLVTERIRRMLKEGEIFHSNTWLLMFTRDVGTLVDALEGVDEIIFKEEGDE